MEIPSFEFALDKEDKWDPILKQFDLEKMRKDIHKLIDPYITYISAINTFFGNYIKNYAMYIEELTYFSEKLEIPLAGILALQLIYELSSACTTGVINTKDGPFYFRTMDWELDILRDYTIQLNITREGEYIATAITWLGYVGILTVGTPEKLIAMNYRRTDHGSLVKNIARLVGMNWPVGYLIRETISNNWSLDVLEKYPLISPCYISILDLNNYQQSKIITRDCDKAVDIRNHTLVQTNVDWDKNFPNILYSVERRNHVLGLKNEDDVLQKLMVFPVKNDATIYFWYRHKGTSNCYKL